MDAFTRSENAFASEDGMIVCRLADMNGYPCWMISVSKRMVEAGVASGLASFLEQFMDIHSGVREGEYSCNAGCVAILLDGYMTDCREIWEIPEAAQFWRSLMNALPYWAYIIHPSQYCLAWAFTSKPDAVHRVEEKQVMAWIDEKPLVYKTLDSIVSAVQRITRDGVPASVGQCIVSKLLADFTAAMPSIAKHMPEYLEKNFAFKMPFQRYIHPANDSVH